MKNTALLFIFLALLCIVNNTTENCSDTKQRVPSHCSYNVTIGNQIYSNVTKTWEPRIGTTGARLAIVIPTVYAVMAMLVMLIARRKTFGLWEIKRTYHSNRLLIYFEDYCGQEMYNLITKRADPSHSHYDYFDKPEDYEYRVYCGRGGVYVEGWDQGTAVRACDVQQGKEFNEMHVSAKQLKKACKFWKYITLPKALKLLAVVGTIFCTPLFKVGWDIVDVGVDCFYFVQLENGTLINSAIMRNPNINNAVLAFAILGCIKSTMLGYGYSDVVRYNEGVDYNRGRSIFLKPVLACLKIVLEDGTELILEYYFVDKFVTQHQPWWLILKDIVTAVLYLVPIVTILTSWRENCRKVCDSDSFRTVFNITIFPRSWLHVYMACVMIHITFSVVTITRVAGMIKQYSSMDVVRECLTVSEGQLIQTPFNSTCLNAFDYTILVCMGIIVLLFIIILCLIVLRLFNKDASKHISWWVANKFNYFESGDIIFNIDGDVTISKCEARKDKLVYKSYRRITTHFEEESVV